MDPEPKAPHDVDGDSSDVVTGPIGSAALVEPTAAKDRSADLDQLPDIDEPSDADAVPKATGPV
jgi:hypothetical protein